MSITVESHFHDDTNTISHLITDSNSGATAIIDPVLDYDLFTGQLATDSADKLLEMAGAEGRELQYILETHAHADHLSGGQYIRGKTGAKLVIGAHIADVLNAFSPVFDAEDVALDGSQFDLLVDEGDKIPLGESEISVLHTPGHTPACVTYVVGDAAFVGDTLFMPDYGTARCDFPGGDAATLYDSIQKIFSLPDETRIFMCHDYLPEGRDSYAWETTVLEEKQNNVHVGHATAQADFIAQRRARDAKLAAPHLILPSLQVNIRAGALPPASPSGKTFLQVPVNIFPRAKALPSEISSDQR